MTDKYELICNPTNDSVTDAIDKTLVIEKKNFKDEKPKSFDDILNTFLFKFFIGFIILFIINKGILFILKKPIKISQFGGKKYFSCLF